ncbi:hypothetical protein KTD31_02525 [Burkholderia multivorans]|jgi:hypothetical protein|uniref:hypothetical protein n=1 Tax=Burkholderia multivorans TaxID=87883 RepID=UPI001C244D52|nr:hypothetical protein [Burkholderia multivorans]MBU9200281.1 hypothetical protein [Burkholderia multivorans]MDN8078593.1 hypothetical protein [Burkholderia multivorans]
MRIIRVILLVLLMSFGLSAQAQMRQYVVANDVEVQYIRGEMRFCERQNVRGITCGFQQNLFGHRSFAARDWWSPETYVQAVTGLNEFTLWNVEPTPDGRGLVIYYSR